MLADVKFANINSCSVCCSSDRSFKSRHMLTHAEGEEGQIACQKENQKVVGVVVVSLS